MRAYRLDLLYAWSPGRGIILTPRSRIRWEENHSADPKEVPEGHDYLLISLVYGVDERGSVVNTGYSISSSIRGGILEELRRLLKTSWIEYADSPDSLNYRIVGLLSGFTGIREWRFKEG